MTATKKAPAKKPVTTATATKGDATPIRAIVPTGSGTALARSARQVGVLPLWRAMNRLGHYDTVGSVASWRKGDVPEGYPASAVKADTGTLRGDAVARLLSSMIDAGRDSDSEHGNTLVDEATAALDALRAHMASVAK